MKTKFLQDFRGRETKEVFYKAGQVVDGDRFAFLAERGIVEIIPDEKPANLVVTEEQIVIDEKPITVTHVKKGKGKR